MIIMKEAPSGGVIHRAVPVHRGTIEHLDEEDVKPLVSQDDESEDERLERRFGSHDIMKTPISLHRRSPVPQYVQMTEKLPVTYRPRMSHSTARRDAERMPPPPPPTVSTAPEWIIEHEEVVEESQVFPDGSMDMELD